MNTDRESFKSRIGFLLVSAGCAIGIGNVWKFPFITGEYGGGVFVLFYLIFLLIMGIPVLTMELAVGRGSKKGAVEGYRTLEPKGSKWHIHGWVCVIGCTMLMMYYTTVAGWMVNYFVKFATGAFEGIGEGEIAGVFTGMLGNPSEMVGYMAITVIGGIAVCSFSLQKGVERITKVMMIGLLALILLLAVHSLTLKGAADGVKFYLLPDFNRAKEMGLGTVITAAMNQAFFTLSLGIGSMEIFGSYMSDDYTLGGEAVRITVLDTFVAIMAGLIIFPACFSYNVPTAQGPSLIFIALPEVFIHMAGGRLWGTLFFIFMTFASFSTVIAVFEMIVAAGIDSFGWSRRKSALICLVLLLVLSLPCALGYNVLSNVHIIGGRDILDSEDFIVSNLLLPTGALIYLLFITTKWGWGFDNYLAEANKGKGLKLPRFLKPFFMFVIPVLILIILVQGLI
ncbi:MAG: sodium-dependent transporter [Lachnospiraceae bacterium]|nr:sodium-dependent transporter [Lachnospiraceae bacterium]